MWGEWGLREEMQLRNNRTELSLREVYDDDPNARHIPMTITPSYTASLTHPHISTAYVQARTGRCSTTGKDLRTPNTSDGAEGGSLPSRCY